METGLRTGCRSHRPGVESKYADRTSAPACTFPRVRVLPPATMCRQRLPARARLRHLCENLIDNLLVQETCLNPSRRDPKVANYIIYDIETLHGMGNAVILEVDLNCYHTRWNCHRTNLNGRRLDALIDDLITPTCHPHNIALRPSTAYERSSALTFHRGIIRVQFRPPSCRYAVRSPTQPRPSHEDHGELEEAEHQLS